MAIIKAATGLGGTLEPRLIRPSKPHKARSLWLPGLGRRLILTKDPGQALQTGRDFMQSHLAAVHRDGDGKVKDVYDCGSGNVQTNLVVALMEDIVGTTSNKATPVLATLTRMYSGTGSTVNTYDVQLQTTAGPASGAITPTLSYTANGTAGTDADIQWVGTIAYTSTLAITEWGLFNAAVQGAQSTSTTNTWNAQGQATATWGTTLGASANLFAGYVAYLSSTTTGLYILSNTTGTSGLVTGSVTPTSAYYLLTTAGGSTSTPASNTSVSIYPLMADHKSFSVINVVNGDSIQFTYTLKIVAGG